MATQPPAPGPGNGPGGNHVGLKIGEKYQLGVQSQNLVLLVFILAVGFLSWERAKTLATHLERLQALQAQMIEAIHTGDTKAHEVFHTEFHALREALLARQVEIQETSSHERTALSQMLATHAQQSQGLLQQCLDQVRQRLPVP